MAVMDWFSRFVLSWALSLTMEVDFCLDALERALRWGRPEIFNIRAWTTAPRPPFSRPASYEEQILLDLGAPPPDPRDFSLYRQNGWPYNQCT
jgi:transposase InsO family protein